MKLLPKSPSIYILIFICVINFRTYTQDTNSMHSTADIDSSLHHISYIDSTREDGLRSSHKDSTGRTNRKSIDSLRSRQNDEDTFWAKFLSNIPIILGSTASLIVIIVGIFKILEFLKKRKKVKDYTPYLRSINKTYFEFDGYIDLEAEPLNEAKSSLKSNQSDYGKSNFLRLLEQLGSYQIIGKPGSGKTSSLKKVVYAYSIKAVQRESYKIPVYVEFKESNIFSQILHIFHSNNLVKEYSLLTENWLREELSQGKYLILIDDIHKYYGTKSKEDTKIEELLSYNKNNFIIAGRDFIKHSIFNLPLYKISTLNEQTMLGIFNYHLSKHDATQLYQEIRWNSSLLALYDTPQMLIYLAQVFDSNVEFGMKRIPENKARVFSLFVKFRNRYEEKKDQSIRNYSQVRDSILCELALYLFKRTVSFYWVDEELCIDIIEKKIRGLIDVDNNRYKSAAILENILKEGFLVRIEDRIKFEHDQWQEYFAALEIFHNNLSVNDFENINSFSEIIYFIAGMHDYDGTIEQRNNCDRFLKEVIKKSYFLFSQCIKNFEIHSSLSERYDSYKNKTFNEKELRIAYEDYLNCYCGIISSHFPKLKEKFAPFTSGEIGVIVEMNKGTTGNLDGFRALKHKNDLKVIVTDKNKIIQKNKAGDKNDTWYYYYKTYDAKNLKIKSLNPVLYELPVIAAFKEINDQLEELIENRKLIDTSEISQERFYCDVMAIKSNLYISKEMEKISYRDIKEGLKKLKIEKQIQDEFVNGNSVDVAALKQKVEELFKINFTPSNNLGSISFMGNRSRVVEDKDIEKRLTQLITLYDFNEDDYVLMPLRELPKNLKWQKNIILKDEIKEEIITWSREFYLKTFKNYIEMIKNNFPTSTEYFETYSNIPVRIVLAIDRTKFINHENIGERLVFGKIISQDEPVIIDVVDKVNLLILQRQLGKYLWYTNPYWGIRYHIAEEEPLTTEVYNLIKDDFDKISR